jgi:release factor glutamine methyltransferase
MTIREALLSAKVKLQKIKKQKSQKNNELIWREAEDLLCFAARQTRERVLSLNLNAPLSRAIKLRFDQAVKKRVRGVPLPYIIGHQRFYGLNFFVTPAVLIPRPETEALVDAAVAELKNVRTKERKNIKVVDIGTGSGCIIIPLCLSVYPFIRSSVHFFATDISAAALAVAKKNAKLHGVAREIKFLHGDLIKPLKQKPDLIVANLPYLKPRALKTNPVLSQEPAGALIGGSDGLKQYKRLFNQIKERKWEKLQIIFEIDYWQKRKIIALLYKFWPFSRPRFIKNSHESVLTVLVAI